MIFIFNKKTVFFLVYILLFASDLIAQRQTVIVHENPYFMELLTEKQKNNRTSSIQDHYKIQIFSGSGDKAKLILNEFKRNFGDIFGTIVFNTPNYKVWVGGFRTRMEAERNFIEIKKKYPSAYLINPNR